ncbi:hypothetical protein PIB30_087353 [Stylosanthes scabra]|uniref:Uncharacterized protein n=1 Tax=Stylosanthes scabra TaxID=79078 RepID=A0ABU6ZS09_9FABA|nr:hypothetical protein [Stylosanthes scabra]
MANQDEEGVVYTDHSDDDQRRDQQRGLQQQRLDLNATTNETTGSGNANRDSGGIQNGQPPLIIQTTAINRVLSTGLDQAVLPPDLLAELDQTNLRSPRSRDILCKRWSWRMPNFDPPRGTRNRADELRPDGIPDPSLAPHLGGLNDPKPLGEEGVITVVRMTTNLPREKSQRMSESLHAIQKDQRSDCDPTH